MRTTSPSITIQEIVHVDIEDLLGLVDESRREGFRFLGRLCEEYADGRNRFDKPGEALFAAYCDGRIVGVAGLNRDPYSGDARVGRVRRVYVLPKFRRTGVGRRLVEEVIDRARGHFDWLALRTDNAYAAAFYESLGFTNDPTMADATHFIMVSK
jgi:GNAT superfamily N-acetyltransferase